MAFVHGSMAIAAAALACIPLVIHLLNRRRYHDEPWAATQFVLAAFQRSRRRLQIEQWILLAVRTLAMALVGLAAARPYLGSASAWSAAGEHRIDRVIILDDSLSMRATHPDGRSTFDEAKRGIGQLLEVGAGRGGVAVVTASRPIRAWTDQPVRDLLAVRQTLDAARCSWSGSDLKGALELARTVLARSDAPAEAREIIVFSDFANQTVGSKPGESVTSGWEGDSDSSRILLVDVGSSDRNNLAVNSISTVGPLVSRNGATTIRVQVSNFAGIDVSDIELVMRDGRSEVGKRPVGELKAGASRAIDFDVLLDSARVHVMEATLHSSAGDRLTEDNHRRCVLTVPKARRVLAVEGHSGVNQSLQDLFYYQFALSGGMRMEGDDRAFVIHTIAPDELGGILLRDYDVVVLGNMSDLNRRDGDRLEQYVRSGGGLVLICGDQMNVDAAAALGKIMPVRLVDQQHATPEQPPTMLIPTALSHPILSDFAGQNRNIFGQANVKTWWRVENRTDSVVATTVLATSTHDPIMITHAYHAGRVVLWLTSVNMLWTNLPAKPDYLPLMMNLTAYAAGDVNVGRNVLVGQVLSERFNVADDGPVNLKRPDGRVDVFEATDYGSTRGWTYRRTFQPGVYEEVNKEIKFCVESDPAESDLRLADADHIRSIFGERAVVLSAPMDEKSGDTAGIREFGWLLAVALLLLVTGESLLGRMFGGVR